MGNRNHKEDIAEIKIKEIDVYTKGKMEIAHLFFLIMIF